jgi:hypothetical protein
VERSTEAAAGTREPAGRAAAGTAVDTRECRLAAPVAEKAAGAAGDPEEQPARTAVGTAARPSPAAHPLKRGGALKPGEAPAPDRQAGLGRQVSPKPQGPPPPESAAQP